MGGRERKGHPTMPLVFRPRAGRALLRVAALSAALLAVATPGAAAAPQDVPPPSCSEPPLSQPFLDWGDDRSYVLVPGQDVDTFTGDGWTLAGGASIATTQIAD